MADFDEGQLQRVLADEERAPELEASITLAKGEVFEHAPLSITCQDIITGVQPPRTVLAFSLPEHLDFDDLNHETWQDVRIGHWCRFRAYEVKLERIHGAEPERVDLRIRKRPSKLVELQYGTQSRLALNEIGRLPDGRFVLVRCLGDYEQVLRLERVGVGSYHEDRCLMIGRGGFARRGDVMLCAVGYLDEPEQPAVQFLLVPQDVATAQVEVGDFGRELRFSLAQVLLFPDGARLSCLRMRRWSLDDWRVELMLSQGEAQREVEVAPGQRKELEVLGKYEVEVHSFFDGKHGTLPGVVATLRKNADPKFTLGQRVTLIEHRTLQSPEGVRLRFVGFGHAHGSSGIDDDGNEIPATWGWYDFHLGWKGQETHLSVNAPDRGADFPVSTSWKGLRLSVLADGADLHSVVVRLVSLDGRAASAEPSIVPDLDFDESAD